MLILPKTVREKSVADSIQKSSTNFMTSDDFVSRNQVVAQLAELQAYIEQRREREPEYVLPYPSGWRVSVLMLTVPDVTEGGVHVVDEMREARGMASPQGVVLSVGRAAFQDKTRFMVDGEIHPWMAVGDRIIWKKYDVTTFQLGNGQRLGFLNDTQAVATIDSGWEIPA